MFGRVWCFPNTRNDDMINNKLRHNLNRNCIVKSAKSGQKCQAGIAERSGLATHISSAVASNPTRVEGGGRIAGQHYHLSPVMPTTLKTGIFT